MRLALAVLLAVAGGALTSFGQSWLPDELRSLANSSGSWCAVAFGVALLPRRPWGCVLAAVLGLLGLLAGYEATSVARGFAVSTGTVAEWVLAAVLVGPFLGVGAAGVVARRPWPAALGTGVLAGVLVGEGVYGLTVVADSTSPVYWTLSLVAGALVPALALARWAPRRTLVAAYGGAGVVAVLFRLVYAGVGSS
jgi:hypothetical protein